MRLNVDNLNNCCKPKRRFLDFKGESEHSSANGKVRYKHFEEINDDVLKLRSILKAHRDVEQSNKMAVFKAIPGVTAGLLGLCIGLAQPGKFSRKIAQGLGFLALLKASDMMFNFIDKKVNEKYKQKPNTQENISKKTYIKVGLHLASMTAMIAGLANIKKIKNVEFLKPVTNFISKEMSTMAKEVDSTKLGKVFKEKIEPFANKHEDLMLTSSFVAPFGIMAGSTFGSIKIAESLSKDIKEKSEQNYQNGKLIQKLAREHFDSIDAIEV